MPLILRQRIQQRNPEAAFVESSESSFVLYLPQICLRKQHNPAFAWACYIANACNIPLVVLAVVLDDSHHPPSASSSPDTLTVVATARRTAFALEAIQEVSQAWEAHGAGVAIRVLVAGRTPHHLTLSRRAAAVVTDTPFVDPYRTFVDRVQQAVADTVPLFTVDGSTTVPPGSVLQTATTQGGRVVYSDVPTKAWQWEKRTQRFRKSHVLGTIREGLLDAPELISRLRPNFFLERLQQPAKASEAIIAQVPKEWVDPTVPCPGKRPWTVQELASISDLKEWVLNCPGIDQTVPPCFQTHGSGQEGQLRWQRFCSRHLCDYAKRRNTITQPHAVSRMSCYLNFGCVSIFQIIHDLWETTHKQTSKNAKDGCQKYESEIVKWREIGYVHCFAAQSDYASASIAIPVWARQWWGHRQHPPQKRSSISDSALASGTTTDATWNAMQQYLVVTGEMHNNARMTWGKTVVHWHHQQGASIEETLARLIYLNDRFALDGLSPPSYAGVLWCFGWCDKPAAPGAAIAVKLTTRYRFQSIHFAQAQRVLLAAPPHTATRRDRKTSDDAMRQHPNKKRQRSIDSFFRTSG